MPFERHIRVNVRTLKYLDYGHGSMWLWSHQGTTWYDTEEDVQLMGVCLGSHRNDFNYNLSCSGLPGEADVPHELLPSLTTTSTARGLPGDDQLYLYCPTCQCLVRPEDVFVGGRVFGDYQHYRHWWRSFFAGRTIDGHTYF